MATDRLPGRRPAEGHDDHGHRADDDRQSLRRLLVAGLFALVPHLRLPGPLRLHEKASSSAPSRRMGGDRPDHLALYLAQGLEASRRRARAHVGRRRTHAQAHPHRPGKRADLVCRHGCGDRAGRRPHLRRQDQGAGRQSCGGAVRPLHRHVGGALCQIRPRGRQEACTSAGDLTSWSNIRPTAAW